MTCYIIGSYDTAFTVGITDCDEMGEVLPFFAFAPTDKIVADIGMSSHTIHLEEKEKVQKVTNAFRKHGTIVFLDNLQAADAMLEMMLTLLDKLSGTPWVARTSKRETLQ